ncbi:hypothetical protein BDBG_16615, partial [Blastomyces gilchristii SLH14081]
SSYIDRSASADDSELNIESLIENLKNVIIKKLSVSCIAESSASLSISSATSFSAAFFSVSFSAALSQSSTLVSVSDSLILTISVSMTLTLTTSASVTVFITSSSHFKKMLYRLSKLYYTRITLSLNSVKIINIHIFRNENADIILFYTHRYETYTSCLK